MNVLLSIKPRFADAIFSGRKKYEYRRSFTRKAGVQTVFVYSSREVGKLTGFFNVAEVIREKPESLWSMSSKHAGISEKEFYDYFNGCSLGYAIKIRDCKRFKEPLDPYEIIPGFTPPQSFRYLEESACRMMTRQNPE